MRKTLNLSQGDVYLTAPSSELGLAAVDDLKEEGCNLQFHQLDINDAASIERIRDMITKDAIISDVMVVGTFHILIYPW